MLDFLIKSSSSNKKIVIQKDPKRFRPIDADLQVPDLKKFRENINWDPEYSFEETMTDLLNYWRDRISKNGTFLER